MNASQLSGSVRPPSFDVGRPAGSAPGSRLDAVAAAPASARERLQVEWLTDRINGSVARDPNGFREASQLAFGAKADIPSINALIDAARSDSLPIPSVQFVGPEVLGAGALGAWDGTTIYLNRSLMNDPATLERVFTEEFGHSLDTRLGGADAHGDEGETFARTLLGEDLSPEALVGLRAENDHGTIDLLALHARPRPVEFSYGYEEAAYGGQTGADNDRGSGSTSNDGEDHNDGSSSDFNPDAPQGGNWEGTWEPDVGGTGNDGEDHNDHERPEVGRKGFEMDLFVGVELDLALFGGGEFSTGYVLDLDTPSESGAFVSHGTAGGGNVGVGLTGGAVFGGNLEGEADAERVNLFRTASLKILSLWPVPEDGWGSSSAASASPPAPRA